MPALYGYTRVSLLKQVEGTSIPDNTERAYKYAQFLSAQNKDYQLGTPEQFMFVDAAVQSDIFLMERRAGCALFAVVQPGDAIVIPLFDRAFRSSADLETTVNYCKARGIRIYILDMPVDVNTPEGEMILGIMACVKRYEKNNLREKTKRSMIYQLSNGRPTQPKAGWKLTAKKVGKYRQLVPDLEYRQQADYILRLHDEEHLSFEEIYHRLVREKVTRICVGHQREKLKGKEWSLGAVHRAYTAAKKGYPMPPSKWAPSASGSAMSLGPSIATPSLLPPEASSSLPVVLDQPPA